MIKSLVLFIVVVVVGSGTNLALGQTETNFTDDTTSTVSTDRVLSPQAKAEAKRLYKEGVKYGSAGLFSQAAEILQRSVKLDPNNANAQFALGHAYYDLKQWRNAIESLKVAVELNPNDEEARDRLGLARAMLWEEDSARIAAERREAPPKSAPPPVSQPNTPAVTEAAAQAESELNAVEASEEVSAPDLSLTKIYRVGPNDVLDIRINESATPQSTLFTITPSGFLEHPLLTEPMRAAGLTVDEIGNSFESELKRRALIENPQVSVGVRDYASHTILVSGLIKDSGTKVLRREAIPLYVVVADAQPLPEAARATVVRNESGETFAVELTQASEMNLLVRPGDVITLHPNVTQYIYVGGEVKLPGEKTYRRGLTLTQAIIAAGGAMPKSKEARLGRGDGKGFLVVTRYKLKDIESGKAPDPVIKPGDRIMIHD
jgi:protein involved in polysaccharide export with SLBB domain